jgi:hypothetical protein
VVVLFRVAQLQFLFFLFFFRADIRRHKLSLPNDVLMLKPVQLQYGTTHSAALVLLIRLQKNIDVTPWVKLAVSIMSDYAVEQNKIFHIIFVLIRNPFFYSLVYVSLAS